MKTFSVVGTPLSLALTLGLSGTQTAGEVTQGLRRAVKSADDGW